MLANYFSEITYMKIIISLIDILLVWFLVYTALKLLSGTRGIQLVKGIIIIVFLRLAFNLIGFQTMSYIIDQLVNWGVLAIIIIFQPEIRRTLEHLGRFNLYNIIFNRDSSLADKDRANTINVVADTSKHMARRRIGALIVLENNTGLDEYAESGIELNSNISNELIINIFIPNTPLHDGALILTKEKIRAASCFLPLSDNKNIASNLGTRHRAAIGLSENTDAIIVVVSEETGHISVAMNGKLKENLHAGDLKNFLNENWLTTNTTLRGDTNG
ncbi:MULTISPECIES: diadenylate cyclase CdaA [unclassified Gemella]|uniref:diadenylate cyclase CdaA n=1 Tax=unclassified Gemella TaxID=2624949 RepID=UPI001C05A575|nr:MULTISPECIES: diadenylate cyclase CdaA [unclassified Gemella]MBU0278194.1 diadenylate cyclase CdaA [Gemella sp. zg-1178]QWQ38849.1 diadenylate cyclase CdaA [Gemella sp. zg-570]